MKLKLKAILTTLFLCGAVLAARANLLFSDAFNYSDGLIETDGVWYAYAPAVPHQDAMVVSNRLILNQANYDGVAAPSTNFTPAGSVVYGSFTINVTTLPSKTGGYFTEFKDYTNDYVCRIFLATSNTLVPGTYRLAAANAATTVGASGVVFYPMDLATNTTYQVVFSYDLNLGATLWVNPGTSADLNVYPSDPVTNSYQQNISISQIAFSQYANQGVAAIGNVMVGDYFTDVVTNAALAPVIGLEPQGSTNYLDDSTTLYVAASGTGQLTYQWMANNNPLTDDGVNVIGSQSNILVLNNLQSTATYSVQVGNAAGNTISSNAVVTVITTPTAPFFTKQPFGATNTLFAYIILSGQADGTGPMTYQWYFEATNASSFTALAGQTSSVLYLDNLGYTNTGSYYVQATGGAGSANSYTSSVVVTPPLTATLAQLHSLMQYSNSGSYNIGLGNYVTVQGVVTSFAPFSATGKTYGEFYIQDASGYGIYVYLGGQGSNNVPPAGALVSVTGPCQVYSGQLEIDPTIGTVINGVTNGIAVLSTNNPLPPSQLLDLVQEATNSLGSYGIRMQCALVTVTNVYIYANNTGGAVAGSFANNAATTLYMTQQPYVAGVTNLVMYVYAATGEATNFWGQPIPGHAYEVTGIMGQYKSTPELYPTRFVDLVTALPAPFTVNIARSNGVPQINWPGVTGSTYSVYGSSSLTGPWTLQAFGLGYYPSSASYAASNTVPRQFYRITTP